MAVVDLVKGKKLADARSINDGDVFRALEEIPVQKHHCIQLAVKTFQKALDEYTQPTNQ
jgi:nitrogen fixation NifU-like protein